MSDNVKESTVIQSRHARNQAAYRQRKRSMAAYLSALEGAADRLRLAIQIEAEKGNKAARKCNSVDTVSALLNMAEAAERGKLLKPNVAHRKRATQTKTA